MQATGGPGAVVWFTGLSGAGKSTLARAVATALAVRSRKVELLDGDEVRQHLSKEIGFSREDRITNILRIAYVAQLLERNGVLVLVAAISPFRDARARARAGSRRFVEVYLSAPLAECIRRDAKGLYARALMGQLKDFTGISQAYEAPLSAELEIDTSAVSVEDGVGMTLSKLVELGYLEPDTKA